MRKFAYLSLAGVALFIVAACSRTPPAPPPSPFRLTATIKDIMDSEVDPSADYLWESVATIVSANGVEEKRPRTDDDWKEVRRRAITLLEATNLLKMEGRAVAKAGEKSENPGIELGPEEIEKVIASDRASWINFANALHDATMKAFGAIETKNAEGLLDAGEAIDTACENCHLKYWYPLDEQAKKAATGAGSVRKS